MCAQCAVGSFCPTASTISTCSAGTYSNTTGATDISACLACGLGTYSSAGASTCLVVRAFELCESAIVLLYAKLDSHCECVSVCPSFPRHFAWIIPAHTMFLRTGGCGCMSPSTLSNGSARRVLFVPGAYPFNAQRVHSIQRLGPRPMCRAFLVPLAPILSVERQHAYWYVHLMACLINRNAPSDFWLSWSVRSCHVSRMDLSVVRSSVPRWCLVCPQQPRLRVVHCQTSWHCNPRTVGGLDRRTLQRVECVLPPLPRLQQYQQHRFLQGIESCCAHPPYAAYMRGVLYACHVLTLFDLCRVFMPFFSSQRLSLPPQAWVSAYGAMFASWPAFSNTLGQDFNLFGSLADLNASTNAWQFCGQYDTVGVAFPGNCGPAVAQVYGFCCCKC
jgi:hypothetical protein